MGDEADADWQDGLVEWGREDAKRKTVACRCGWCGDQSDLINNQYNNVRRCPICDGGFIRWTIKRAQRQRP